MIPARGGSKRVPRKNLKTFAGVPAIERVIRSCRDSGAFDHIWVSTEDEEIADFSAGLGASVLARPAELADDFTPTIPVVRHFIESRGLGDSDTVACVYPTAVLLDATTLRRAAEEHSTSPRGRAFTFGALPFSSSPYRSFTFRADDGLQMLYPEHYESRSQDLEPVFHDAGAFYFASISTWLGCDKVFVDSSAPFLLDESQAVDIDTQADWSRAEIIFLLNQLQLAQRD